MIIVNNKKVSGSKEDHRPLHTDKMKDFVHKGCLTPLLTFTLNIHF